MSEAQGVVKRHLYENPPRFDLHLYDLGAGEVDALRVALYNFVRQERRAFNDGDPNGERISTVGHNADSIYKILESQGG